MSHIRCNVEECHYNSSEICQASTIKVRSRVADHMTSISDDTACETFVPKKV
ncbi:DUF1540 domain-containing protein [Heliobacterium undosum]|uniref:DUF1540 domain-containing protein n=1 Tax=Heliomicrobium undosum TaxID=121734 RepID=A0A845L7W2_9FIRM|nr:DUF1540 domain-containing protein [Heliomicrobium undosum]MZP29818.1 DUF1540 domain-containing protein [Heliomicrobium undosum]